MGSLAVTVRRTGPGDAHALREIRLEALADSPDAYGSTLAEVRRWPARHWRRIAREGHYFLAFVGGSVAGMASGGLNDAHPGTRWLYGMYVTPDARGTGVADHLVEAVERWARDEGVDELYLHVADVATRARAFYERRGFHPTGEGITMDRDPRIVLSTMVHRLDA